MKKLFLIVVTLLLATDLFAFRLDDYYRPGDKTNFSITRQGKVIGTQNTECSGWEISGADSLLRFDMSTVTVYNRGGKTFDLSVKNTTRYILGGLPKKYDYELDLLNATIEHAGEFDGKEYKGTESRLGIKQPFMYETKRWPVLFDNNFALQWEIALRPLRLRQGDSVAVDVLIPQLNQLTFIKVYAQPEENLNFEGKQVHVRVYKIVPANQTFYVDETGKLIKAFDNSQQITIARLPEGEQATIARKSLFNTIKERIPGYLAIIVLAAIWFVGFEYKSIKRAELYLLVLLGAVLYSFLIKLLDPIQSAYFRFALDPANPTNSYVVLFGSALLVSLLEEGVKYLAVLGHSFTSKSKELLLGLSIGAACGIGFGLFQACNLTAFDGSGSLIVRSDLFQKFFLIGINAGTGALLGMFVARNKPFAFYLIPIGLKTLFNWLIAFVQKGIMTHGFYIFMTFLFALIVISLDYWYYKEFRGRRAHKE